MAFYRCEVNNISRGKDGKGKSSVAAAAYRAGVDLYDERKNEGKGGMHHYHYREPEVVSSKISLPENAPEWAKDRQGLWNGYERAETYKNARTAKELVLSLPYEMDAGDIHLTNAQQAVDRFVNERIVKPFGVAVDVSFHKYGRKHAEGDEEVLGWKDKGLPFLDAQKASEAAYDHVLTVTNKKGETIGYKHYAPHAHVLMGMRRFDDSTETGFAKKKDRELDKRQQVFKWREAWQDDLNTQFLEMGSDLQVSCKPLKKENEKTDSFEFSVYSTKPQERQQVDIETIPAKPPDRVMAGNLVLPDFSDDSRMQEFTAYHQIRKLTAEERRLTTLEQACIDDTDRMFQAWALLKSSQTDFKGVYSHQMEPSEVMGYLPKKGHQDSLEMEMG